MAKKEEQIKIIDESHDKDYFSMLPNYIVNHSSAIDQALYWQMKRIAGEKGICYASEKFLIKQLSKGSQKVGYDVLKRSINYLLENKWIKYIGKVPRKTRPTNGYKIIDIWKINTDFYSKKIVSESKLSKKDTLDIQSMIVSESPTKEEPIEEELVNTNVLTNSIIIEKKQKGNLTDMRLVTDYYLTVKNIPIQKNPLYPRFMKSARMLLELAGTVDNAKLAIDRAEDYDDKGLTWKLETVIKNYYDLIKDKKQEHLSSGLIWDKNKKQYTKV